MSFKGPIDKFIPDDLKKTLIELADLKQNDTIFFIADNEKRATELAGQIRTELGKRLNLIDEDVFQFCWIIDFPMFELDDHDKLAFSHNPFSMPQGGLEALENQNPLEILAYQYDIVCNGIELSSGAVRNHDIQIMLKAFQMAGYTEEEVKNGEHIAMKMDLIEAIRLGIVVNPKIVSCEYNITHGDTLEKLLERINQIEDEDKRNELLQKYENLRRNISDAQGIPELLTQNIQKKNGRYIVFIPVSDNGEDLEDEYGNKSGKKTQEDKIKEAEMQLREWLKGVDETKYDDKGNIIDGPEIYSMLGQYSQKRNAKELNGFETSDSEHMKIMIVMNKLNEGVHVKGIDGIIWTRALDENSKILLLQQLGRAIYGIDPERPVKDEDRPVVIDLPNNMLNVDLEKTINTYSQRDDLNLLNEMVEWVQAHNGYIPDINSKSSEESRRAITLKRIQRKYEKYLQNPEEEYSYLDEEEIEEIQKILKTGSKIDLWEIEFPDKIRKDGKKIDENELENINFFIEGTLKDLYDLQEDINDEEEKGVVERFIRKLEILKRIGVDVTKIVRRDNIKELAKKSGIDEKEIEKAGLNPGDNIGLSKRSISIFYRKAKEEGKITKGTPTDEQVETLRKLGISLERKRKRKSSKALAEATISAINNPDMLDEEQQALDEIVSQTKEKGGKNGKEQS